MFPIWLSGSWFWGNTEKNGGRDKKAMPVLELSRNRVPRQHRMGVSCEMSIPFRWLCRNLDFLQGFDPIAGWLGCPFSLCISWKQNSFYVHFLRSHYLDSFSCVLGVNGHLVMPESMTWCAYLLESIFLDYVAVIWQEQNRWIIFNWDWDYVIGFCLLPFGKYELPDDCNSLGS